jgi:hypothetical protein
MDTRIIMEFILDKIPLVVDLDSGDLKYDSKNIYYHIYKYMLELQRKANK